jgi:alkylated DNA nucleotide flippase Atl1
MAYGDIAEYLAAGPGPRQVGRVLAVYGGAVPWWRVTHSDGTPAPGHDSRALEHYLAEGTPLRSARPPVRVDMPRARWPGHRLSKKIVEIMAYLEFLGNYSYPNLPRKPYHPRKSR